MKIVLWVAGILIGLLTIGTVISTINQKTVKTEKTIKNDDIKNIKIKGNVGDITVVKGNNDTFSIEQVYSNKKHILDVQEKGDTLIINSNVKNFISFDLSFMFNTEKEKDLKVTLPARVYDEITISNSVGDMKVEDVEGKTIVVKTSTGDIHTNQLTAKQITLTSTIGDVSAYKINGDIKAKTSTGEVTIVSKENNTNIEASSTLGDVHITIPQEPKDARVKGKTTLGDIKLFGKNEDDLLFGNGTKKISGKTSTGDITIDTNE